MEEKNKTAGQIFRNILLVKLYHVDIHVSLYRGQVRSLSGSKAYGDVMGLVRGRSQAGRATPMWVKAINRGRARHIADSDQIATLQTLKALGGTG